jgi:hypothetical protein
VISVGHWNEDHRRPGVALRGQRPGADGAGQVRRHSPEPRRRCARGSPPVGPVTWPLPEVEGAAPRFTRSRLCFVMSRLPMLVVTCPGPGRPVTFSPPTYVIRHVRGERTPAPATGQAPGSACPSSHQWPTASLRSGAPRPKVPAHNAAVIPPENRLQDACAQNAEICIRGAAHAHRNLTAQSRQGGCG